MIHIHKYGNWTDAKRDPNFVWHEQMKTCVKCNKTKIRTL